MNVMETLADLLDTDVDRARVVWRDGKPMARHRQWHICRMRWEKERAA